MGKKSKKNKPQPQQKHVAAGRGVARNRSFEGVPNPPVPGQAVTKPVEVKSNGVGTGVGTTVNITDGNKDVRVISTEMSELVDAALNAYNTKDVAGAEALRQQTMARLAIVEQTTKVPVVDLINGSKTDKSDNIFLDATKVVSEDKIELKGKILQKADMQPVATKESATPSLIPVELREKSDVSRVTESPVVDVEIKNGKASKGLAVDAASVKPALTSVELKEKSQVSSAAKVPVVDTKSKNGKASKELAVDAIINNAITHVGDVVETTEEIEKQSGASKSGDSVVVWATAPTKEQTSTVQDLLSDDHQTDEVIDVAKSLSISKLEGNTAITSTEAIDTVKSIAKSPTSVVVNGDTSLGDTKPKATKFEESKTETTKAPKPTNSSSSSKPKPVPSITEPDYEEIRIKNDCDCGCVII